VTQHESEPKYDIAIIRNLLLTAFEPEDLRRFCHDRRDFKPVLYRFGPGYGFDDMVDELINYCVRELLVDKLLGEVKQVKPKQYARSFPDDPPPRPEEATPDETPEPISKKRWGYPALIVFAVVIVLVIVACLAIVLRTDLKFDEVRYRVNNGRLYSVTNRGNIHLKVGDELLIEEIWYQYRGLPIGEPETRVEMYIRKERPEPEFEWTTTQVALSTGRNFLEGAKGIVIEEDYWDQVTLVLMQASKIKEAGAVDRFYIDLLVEPVPQD
jgi:hypothetical protein